MTVSVVYVASVKLIMCIVNISANIKVVFAEVPGGGFEHPIVMMNIINSLQRSLTHFTFNFQFLI